MGTALDLLGAGAELISQIPGRLGSTLATHDLMMPRPTSEPEQLWFLDTLVTVRVSQDDGSDGVSVLEHHAPRGDSAPLHLHRTEDEIFHILEGELRFLMDGEEKRLRAGDIVLAPKGIAHTYRVESAAGARWLTITARGDFERFVRSMSRVAERAELPEIDGTHSQEMEDALIAAAGAHGIDIVGPPLG